MFLIGSVRFYLDKSKSKEKFKIPLFSFPLLHKKTEYFSTQSFPISNPISIFRYEFLNSFLEESFRSRVQPISPYFYDSPSEESVCLPLNRPKTMKIVWKQLSTCLLYTSHGSHVWFSIPIFLKFWIGLMVGKGTRWKPNYFSCLLFRLCIKTDIMIPPSIFRLLFSFRGWNFYISCTRRCNRLFWVP